MLGGDFSGGGNKVNKIEHHGKGGDTTCTLRCFALALGFCQVWGRVSCPYSLDLPAQTLCMPEDSLQHCKLLNESGLLAWLLPCWRNLLMGRCSWVICLCKIQLKHTSYLWKWGVSGVLPDPAYFQVSVDCILTHTTCGMSAENHQNMSGWHRLGLANTPGLTPDLDWVDMRTEPDFYQRLPKLKLNSTVYVSPCENENCSQL